MKLFEPLTLKFETGNWASDPELGVMDTILEQNPRLIKMLEEDITQGKPPQHSEGRIRRALNK